MDGLPPNSRARSASRAGSAAASRRADEAARILAQRPQALLQRRRARPDALAEEPPGLDGAGGGGGWAKGKRVRSAPSQW